MDWTLIAKGNPPKTLKCYGKRGSPFFDHLMLGCEERILEEG